MNNKIQRIVFAAMFAAFVCVATMVIQIPSPLGGYINLGDAVILFTTAFMSPLYAFLASAIGSALADVFSGFVLYAPATFLVKGLMALVSCLVFKAFKDRIGSFASRLLGGILSEILMVSGYYVFEGFIYGFGASLVNIPPNLVQGGAGLALGLLLIKLFEKTKFFKTL